MESARSPVELMEKNRPRQQRAIKTYEAILDATGELLVEVGLERISTNIIAERAGITVPALYRYFPNKYSVLNALGSRLMERQNEAFAAWHTEFAAGKSADYILENIDQVLRVTYDVTRAEPGGVETMHALQSIGPLQQVRLESHWKLAQAFGSLWAQQFGAEFTDLLLNKSRVAIELGSMAVVLALEDERLDPDFALKDAGRALKLYLADAMRSVGATME